MSYQYDGKDLDAVEVYRFEVGLVRFRHGLVSAAVQVVGVTSSSANEKTPAVRN